jgi:uncharacterized membrane protein
MDAFSISKFIHVAAAVLWLGGGISHVILGFMARSKGNDDDLLSVVRNVAKLGKNVLVPCTVVTLLSGLAMVWFGGLTWDAWIVFGLLGILATGAIGGMVLGPTSEKVAGLAGDSARRSEALVLSDKLLRFASADSAGLAAIVYLMVMKPTWQDTAGWVSPLIVTGVLVAYFLMLRTRRNELR